MSASRGKYMYLKIILRYLSKCTELHSMSARMVVSPSYVTQLFRAATNEYFHC